jgi:hypothetical protein
MPAEGDDIKTKEAIEVRPEVIPSSMVQDFVLNAHGDISRVKELLQAEPALVNACWDWGGGDWETGLGAAAHVGRRDIAAYLLDHGARTDIFAAAMLGQIEVVRAILQAHPEMRHALGPHGIPLAAHAEAGGEAAADVARLLEDLG